MYSQYYFSVENMNNDDFLRRAMDKKGWIQIDTLLGFNRMKEMQVTKDELIKVVNNSKTIETVVEVGIPRVLKPSKSITSVIITARKMNIISEK